jgi:hypothetical protein
VIKGIKTDKSDKAENDGGFLSVFIPLIFIPLIAVTFFRGIRRTDFAVTSSG